MSTAGEFPVLAVAGPTASGKSALSLKIARECNGEIVNCDSVQLYRGFDIGSAKLPLDQRQGIPHHLLDLFAPTELCTAGDFSRIARSVILEITRRGRVPILTGGTGFYLRALFDGLAPTPGRDDSLRRRLAMAESRRRGTVHRLLTRLDRAAAARIHANDTQKAIRAIEISWLAGRPAAEVFAQGRDPFPGAAPLILVLHPPRAELAARIGQRTRSIFESGLLEEVRNLLAGGVPPCAKAFESIGYKEALACVRGELSPQAALEAVTIATRQYAKRQIVWFRKERNVRWIPYFGETPDAGQMALDITRTFLSKFTSSPDTARN